MYFKVSCEAFTIFVKYIIVSLVSILGSSVGSLSSYSNSGPKIDPSVQYIFGANVSFSTDSRRACCQLLAVKIRVMCLRRLAKEECGSETNRRDIRGGQICNDICNDIDLITALTHLLDLYTIYGMKYQGFIF